MDSIYRDLLTTDSLLFFASGRVLTPSMDSSHYLYFTYYDELNDDDSQASVSYPGETGVLLGKINEQGDFIWRKRFADPTQVNFKPLYSVLCLKELSDTSLFITLRESKQFASTQSPQKWAKIHFYTLDTMGNELEHYTFQDGQLNSGGYGLLKIDSSVIYPNLVSEYSIIPPSTQLKWWHKSVLTCLDENYEMKGYINR
ncbi:MAG: hypothetical protein P8P74_10940 [Crocinitomicaceae bacterium]|nr:hypothetical protein [Crocinitomicaceae bacterium]